MLALRCALGLLFALLMGYLARLLVELKAHERGLATQVGGDEFILLLPGADARGAVRVAS